MEIKTKKHFRNLIESLAEEVLEEEDLDEMTTTASAGGEPMAFDPKGKKKKTKKKMGEGVDKEDIKMIRKLIRDVVGSVFRDIWLKRNSWK